MHKKNRGETVSLVLTLHYGNHESLKGQTAVAGMLPGLMMAGTKKHDRQALREELDCAGHPHLDRAAAVAAEGVAAVAGAAAAAVPRGN